MTIPYSKQEQLDSQKKKKKKKEKLELSYDLFYTTLLGPPMQII